MLGQTVRMILFWVTVLVVIVVVVSGMLIVLDPLIRRDQVEATVLDVQPAEVALCQQESVLFQVEPSAGGVEWAATGGAIDGEGFYTAGELAGDYEVRAVGPGGEQGRAFVHVLVCTPTPPPVPTATLVPLPTPTVPATPMPPADAQVDIKLYETGAPAATFPTGLDIRNASVGADMRVVLEGAVGLPTELVGWAQEGEAVLWMELYDPIPDPPAVRTDWLFALDLDGDIDTGRPAGIARINPDLGMETALGWYYDPDVEAYTTYFLIWEANVGNWLSGPDVLRTWVNAERTLVAIAVPVDVLQQKVTEITGVVMAPWAVTGRAAAIAYTWPDAVVDFYPNRPE